MWLEAYILKPGETSVATFGPWLFLEWKKTVLNAAFSSSSCACLHCKRSRALAGARLKEPTVGKECKLGNEELRGGTEGVGELVSLLPRMWERGKCEEENETNHTAH